MTNRNPLPGKKQRMGAPDLEFILKTVRFMMNGGPEKPVKMAWIKMKTTIYNELKELCAEALS
jgi:hypothetical protein